MKAQRANKAPAVDKNTPFADNNRFYTLFLYYRRRPKEACHPSNRPTKVKDLPQV